MKPSPSLFAVLALVAFAGCRHSGVPIAPAPSAPEATVAQFLAAVNANDLNQMELLWGTERGPSTISSPNPRDVRRRQLQVMQRLLAADENRITGTEMLDADRSRRRLQVELIRGGRRVTVPFVLVVARTGGWLISEIGIDQAMALSVGPVR